MYIRCQRCRGAKQVMGMGSIYKDCEVCKGVGMVKQEKLEPVETAHLHEQINKEIGKSLKEKIDAQVNSDTSVKNPPKFKNDDQIKEDQDKKKKGAKSGN